MLLVYNSILQPRDLISSSHSHRMLVRIEFQNSLFAIVVECTWKFDVADRTYIRNVWKIIKNTFNN